MKSILAYFKLCIVVLISLSSCSSRPTALLITSSFTSQNEIDSLSKIIEESGTKTVIIPISDIKARLLSKADVVAYHRSDSSDIADDEIRLKELILPYVEMGGSLLLTMDAVRLSNAWGIEYSPVTVEHQDAYDSGFGRALGFHGYRQHPIFENLAGGAYVWKGTYDHKDRTLGFSKGVLPKSPGTKILGVNWAYIHYHEGRKLIWETPLGKGRILSIGAYMHCSEDNVNKSTLKRFVGNVTDYLHGKRKFESAPCYWRYDSIPLAQGSDFVYDGEIKDDNGYVADFSNLGITRMADKQNYWNLAGQQILAMGKECGKVDEVWIHPIMALKDLRVAIKLRGSDAVHWTDTIPAVMSRAPHVIKRTYSGVGESFTESIVVSPLKALMNVNYQWDNEEIDSVFVAMTSNMRLMWPYSLESTGTLYYSHDKDGAVTSVYDTGRNLNLVTAFSRRPSSLREGMVDFKHMDISRFHNDMSEDKQITFLYGFSGDTGRLSLYVSGGEGGVDNGVSVVADAMGNSVNIYKDAESYYDNLNKNLLSIRSSDTIFNKAYRMAVMSTNKFFCHTPSIGKSLMAGFCTTARGWNGGQKVSGRPGYAWYFGRDTEWTGTVLNYLGDYEKVRDILTTFGKFQDPDGKIYHELTTSGSVHYDAADATPLYIILAGDYLRRSGDLEFIKSQWPHIKKAIDFCRSTDTDGDGLIENTGVGHGWQEAYQLHGAHTEVYLASAWAKALDESSYMASCLGKKDEAHGLGREALKVKEIINSRFWNDSTQFYNHGLMKDGTFQTEKCVLGGTPVLFRIADGDKAVKTALNFSSKYYSTDWGVRMVGYDSKYFGIGGYTYGNIWPFHTGCAAIAEYNAGLFSQGYRHAYSSLLLYDTWDYGNMAEVIQGDALKFTGICPHQQWSSSMNLRPLFEGMLGIDTDAICNQLHLSPAFPVDWEYVDVNNIRIGENSLNMNYSRDAGKYTYTLITNGEHAINVSFKAILPASTIVRGVNINGEDTAFDVSYDNGRVNVSLSEFALDNTKSVSIEYVGGIGVMANMPAFVKGMSDNGLKIEAESFDRDSNVYTLNLAGVPGRIYRCSVFAKSAMKSLDGCELESQIGDSINLKVSFPESSEPYSSRIVKVKI